MHIFTDIIQTDRCIHNNQKQYTVVARQNFQTICKKGYPNGSEQLEQKAVLDM
jgi:hypothetical protein